MNREIKLRVKDVEVTASMMCTFSMLVRIEFLDESKRLLSTGYKNVNLGLAQYPEKMIGEESASVEVLKVAEWLFESQATITQVGEVIEEKEDAERFAKWRKLLGKKFFDEKEDVQKAQPIQLQLNF